MKNIRRISDIAQRKQINYTNLLLNRENNNAIIYILRELSYVKGEFA